MASLLSPLLNQFARRYDYDVSYMHTMERDNPGTLWRYMLMVPFSQHRTAVPVEHYFTAKLLSTQAQDCGPCLSLVVQMARQADVDAALLLALLRDDRGSFSSDTALVVDFTRAVLAAVPAAEELRQAVVSRWGAGAAGDLALAIAFGGFYPTLKRGLGRAASCEPLMAGLQAELSSLQAARG